MSTAPILAVSLWEKYLDTKPNAQDTAAANAEMAKWKDLDKQHAEKINGKWIGGEEPQEAPQAGVRSDPSRPMKSRPTTS